MHCNAIFLLQKKITFQNWFWSMECATFLFSFFLLILNSYHLKLQRIYTFLTHFFYCRVMSSQYSLASSTFLVRILLLTYLKMFHLLFLPELAQKSKTNPKKQWTKISLNQLNIKSTLHCTWVSKRTPKTSNSSDKNSVPVTFL